MNCPLFKAAAIMSQNRTNSCDVSCDEGDCAWWDEAKKRCSVRMISHLLEASCLALNTIAKELTLLRPK
ncbi:hypothetical protein LCGC14_2188880 [marine sediment metagenome]|uniref:Uncharacterized protein n=1 Tax=marine sediment metagenome TaxID=412755 RepID=A0A0F9DK31_9ZZZZ